MPLKVRYGDGSRSKSHEHRLCLSIELRSVKKSKPPIRQGYTLSYKAVQRVLRAREARCIRVIAATSASVAAELRALRSPCNTVAYVVVRPPGRCCTRRIRQVTDGLANCQLKFTVQGLRTTRSSAICLACTKFLVEVHLHGARTHCRKIRRLCSQRSHRLQHTMGADTHSSKSWYLHARCFLARAYYFSFSPQ